jgi:hypothetical protein
MTGDIHTSYWYLGTTSGLLDRGIEQGTPPNLVCGSLTYAEIHEVGAHCIGPNDPASLLATQDIDVLWNREGYVTQGTSFIFQTQPREATHVSDDTTTLLSLPVLWN